MAALRLSFGTAALAAAINGPSGLLSAWVLVRYRFRGRNLADSLIDVEQVATADRSYDEPQNPFVHEFPG